MICVFESLFSECLPLKTAHVRNIRRKIFQSSKEPSLILITAQICHLKEWVTMIV